MSFFGTNLIRVATTQPRLPASTFHLAVDALMGGCFSSPSSGWPTAPAAHVRRPPNQFCRRNAEPYRTVGNAPMINRPIASPRGIGTALPI